MILATQLVPTNQLSLPLGPLDGWKLDAGEAKIPEAQRGMNKKVGRRGRKAWAQWPQAVEWQFDWSRLHG